MKKAGLWLLAVLLVVTGGCGKPHTDTSDLSLPGEVSTSVTSHSHQTTTTTTTTTTTATTTTTTTTATTTTTTTKKPTTTTTVPTTTTTTVPTTTTTTVPTTTLPPGDYSAYERLAAAMARTMDSDSLQLTIQRSSCWLQNAGDTPLFSEFDLRYAVADTSDPLSARRLTSFCSATWSEDNKADQYYYSFTNQKDVHWIHNDKGYAYTTDGLPAWATLADSMLQELTTLPPKASMVNLEELPPLEAEASKGFYNSPYYEVPVEGSVFANQYPSFVRMGARLAGVDIEDTTSISVPEACFYYALTFSGNVRAFKVFYQLRLQGERNGTLFDQVWQISIDQCTLGDPDKNTSFGPLSELTHLDGAAHFTEIDDPGLGYLFQDVQE